MKESELKDLDNYMKYSFNIKRLKLREEILKYSKNNKIELSDLITMIKEEIKWEK